MPANRDWSLLGVFFLLFLSLMAGSCSSGGSSSSLSVSLDQTSAPPGTLIALEGLDPNRYTPADLEVVLVSTEEGKTSEPALVAGNGTANVVFSVPLYYDNISKWPDPPEDPVSVDIYYQGNILIHVPQALTVESLPPAPGTMDAIEENLIQIVQNMSAIIDQFPSEVSLEDQYLTAMIETLDVLVNGDSAYSLATAMADIDSDPEAKALLDALFVSSGAVEHLSRLQGLISSLQQPLVVKNSFSLFASQAHAAIIPTPIGDTALAKKIQLYEILQLFGQEVVSATALTAGTVSGLVGIVVNVPAVTIAQAIITVVDLVVNKIVVGLLPAHLTDIELSLADNQLDLDETSDATVTLHAANIPVSLTMQDMIGLLLSGMGFANSATSPPGWVDSFETAFMSVVAFATGQMQTRVAAYASANPDASVELDLDLTETTPLMTWEATATNRDLLTLYSSSPDILATLPEEINWQADSDNTGSSSIRVQTASGSNTLLWNLPSSLPYVGGAFGTDVTSSEAVTVYVASDLGLEASFPSNISPSGSGVLHVLAGDLLSDSSIEPQSGLDVAIQVTGGSPEESLGTTDDQGLFTTVVWPEDGATEMTIRVMVADPITDRYVEKTLEATVQDKPFFTMYAGRTEPQIPTDPWDFPSFSVVTVEYDNYQNLLGESSLDPAEALPLFIYDDNCMGTSSFSLTPGDQRSYTSTAAVDGASGAMTMSLEMKPDGREFTVGFSGNGSAISNAGEGDTFYTNSLIGYGNWWQRRILLDIQNDELTSVDIEIAWDITADGNSVIGEEGLMFYASLIGGYDLYPPGQCTSPIDLAPVPETELMFAEQGAGIQTASGNKVLSIEPGRSQLYLRMWIQSVAAPWFLYDPYQGVTVTNTLNGTLTVRALSP